MIINTLKYVALLITIFLNMSSSWASDSNAIGCLYQGELIEPFKSVWIKDAVLTKEYIDHYKSIGVTDANINKRLKNADWTGFRLVCHPIIAYQPIENPQLPAQGFTISSYALTFNEYSMDFYLDIQEQIKEKKLAAANP